MVQKKRADIIKLLTSEKYTCVRSFLMLCKKRKEVLEIVHEFCYEIKCCSIVRFKANFWKTS